MTDTFLGVIAFSTLIMALIQVSVLLAVYLAVRKVQEGAARIEEAARPVLTQVEHISREAAASIAEARTQISRGGDSFKHVLERVEDTVDRVEGIVGAPAREGAAIVAGARAVVGALRRPFWAGRKGPAGAHTSNGDRQPVSRDRGGHDGGEMRTSGMRM
jgi:hypothetical protein